MREIDHNWDIGRDFARSNYGTLELKIRRATDKDAQVFLKWWSNGELMKSVGFPEGLKVNELDLLATLRRIEMSNTKGLFIIDLNKSPIGECNFRVVDIQTAEIGIKIFEKSNRRQKIGTATIQLLSQYLIEKGICTLLVDPLVENIDAIEFYRRVGFHEKEIKKDCWVDPSGKPRSAILLSRVIGKTGRPKNK